MPLDPTPSARTASPETSSRVARLHNMLDYVLQYVQRERARLDNADAAALFDRARDELTQLQRHVVAYAPALGWRRRCVPAKATGA